MIHEVVPLIASELRDYLVSKFDASGDVVKMSTLANQDGSTALKEENVVVVTLVNVERDGSNMLAGGSGKGNMPVYVNLYVMFSTYFTDYVESLKFLSGVIGYFQANPNYLHMGNSLKIELFNIDFRELSNLWMAVGGKYLPSVVYRIRTLDMDEDLISDEIPPVAGMTFDPDIPGPDILNPPVAGL